MPKSPKNTKPETLKGWQQIAAFLGKPPSSGSQRWASEGTPVHKEGRFVTTSADELNAWLGRDCPSNKLALQVPTIGRKIRVAVVLISRERFTPTGNLGPCTRLRIDLESRRTTSVQALRCAL